MSDFTVLLAILRYFWPLMRAGPDFRYTKNSARPRSDFIYTKNSARPKYDFIYTESVRANRDRNFLYTKNCVKKRYAKSMMYSKKFPRCARPAFILSGGRCVRKWRFSNGKTALQGYKNFPSFHFLNQIL